MGIRMLPSVKPVINFCELTCSWLGSNPCKSPGFVPERDALQEHRSHAYEHDSTISLPSGRFRDVVIPKPKPHEHEVMSRATVRSLAKLRSSFVHSISSKTSFSASAYDAGFVEVRQYTLVPEKMKEYLKLADEYAALRKRINPGFLSFFTCETGSVLNRVTHFYHYKDLDERDKIRKEMSNNPDWQSFIDKSRSGVQMQESMLFLQATECHKAAGACNIDSFTSPAKDASIERTPIYEMRTYQLDPGYGSAPKLRGIFAKGLPAKVAADSDGKLVFIGYTDVGKLNYVMELWRYSSAQASIQARKAAREVEAWRQAIAAVTPMVQVFETRILVPAPFSPWQ